MTHNQRSAERRPERCDICGEDDGTVARVVLIVGKRVEFRRRLCRSCQYTAIVSVAAPQRRPL